MAFTLDGRITIANKFKADVEGDDSTGRGQMSVIGVKIANAADKFKGAFATSTELNSAVPSAQRTLSDIAFVLDRDSTGPTWMKVVSNAGFLVWVPILFNQGTNDIHYPDEVAYVSDTQLNQSLVAKNVTFNVSATTGDLTLNTSSGTNYYYFQITPASNELVVIQGIRFRRKGDAQSYYEWGLGLSDWAYFSEPGQYVVKNWSLDLEV
jgi:hypothetical protein